MHLIKLNYLIIRTPNIKSINKQINLSSFAKIMLYNTRGVNKRTQEEKELPGRF